MTLETERALVLRATPYGETSRIVRLLTDRWGVVSGVARGSRRPGQSGWVPFSSGEVTLVYRQGKDLQTFRSFVADRHRLGLTDPPLRFAGASAFAEVLARAAPEAPDLGLATFADERLDALEAAAGPDVPALVLQALWQLVALLGFEPALDECVQCGRPLGHDEIGRLDFARGGIRCAGCAGAQGSGPRMGPGARTELAGFLTGGTEATEHLAAHLRLLADFVRFHVGEGRELRSFDFLLALVA